EGVLADEGERALRASLLVAMGGVDQDRQIRVARELDLRREAALLGRRDLVEADLADRDHALFLEIERQELEHAVGESFVVRFFRVEPHRREMTNPELARTEALPAEQREEIVLEGSDVRSRLTHPKRRL